MRSPRRPGSPGLLAALLLALAGPPAVAASKGPPPPTVGHVEPCRGPAAGGTPVTIIGSNFWPGARVTFGEAEAPVVAFVASDRITAVTPPHRPGRVYVSVLNPNWQSGGRGWTFTYVDQAPSEEKR